MKFKWWNLVLNRFMGIEDINLSEEPKIGDILTYWNSERSQAGAFAYLSNGWTNVTDDYFGNTGNVHHPAYPNDIRVLTWKSAEEKQPSWVTQAYFNRVKSHYTSNTILTLSGYKRGFQMTPSRGAEGASSSNPIDVNMQDE